MSGTTDNAPELLAQLTANAAEQIKFAMKNLGDAGCEALAPALEANTTLTQLDLSCNSINAAGTAALAAAVGPNKSLALFDLSANAVGDDGAVALADALAGNTAITALDLHANSIGDAGAVALARCLGANTTLKVLDLRANYIGDVGAGALVEAARSSRTLKELNVHCNDFGAPLQAALEQLVASKDCALESLGAEVCVCRAFPYPTRLLIQIDKSSWRAGWLWDARRRGLLSDVMHKHNRAALPAPPPSPRARLYSALVLAYCQTTCWNASSRCSPCSPQTK